MINNMLTYKDHSPTPNLPKFIWPIFINFKTLTVQFFSGKMCILVIKL